MDDTRLFINSADIRTMSKDIKNLKNFNSLHIKEVPEKKSSFIEKPVLDQGAPKQIENKPIPQVIPPVVVEKPKSSLQELQNLPAKTTPKVLQAGKIQIQDQETEDEVELKDNLDSKIKIEAKEQEPIKEDPKNPPAATLTSLPATNLEKRKKFMEDIENWVNKS